MRHRVDNRHLGRPTDQRLAILKSLVAAVLEHGKVTTTEARAKEALSVIEKIITLSREDNLTNRRLARRWIPIGQKIKTAAQYENVTGEPLKRSLKPRTPTSRPLGLTPEESRPFGERLIHKLFTEIGPRFKDRPGGYLRLTKLGGDSHENKHKRLTIRPARRGDAAKLVMIEMVD